MNGRDAVKRRAYERGKKQGREPTSPREAGVNLKRKDAKIGAPDRQDYKIKNKKRSANTTSRAII